MPLVSSQHQVLNTDLYQLTMAGGYFVAGLTERRASFELYLRRLPRGRSFGIAAGLEQALDYLAELRFDGEELDALRGLPVFAGLPPAFFDYLGSLRFEGDVWALPEGTAFFPYEPILRISAPLIQAQLVETWLLAMINYQSGVASKAARIALAISNSGSQAQFVDFGSRRAHGPQASLLAARAAYIGGAAGTSNVCAAHELGIPVVGTAAHAWTMAFASEPEAFAAYREAFPGHSTLLVDTYDTIQGIRHAIASGAGLQGIRLDSGDFLSLSREARAMLDAAGLEQTKIVVSGDMNEYKIAALLAAGAPIDSFGVGTELATCIDAPSLGGVYKLAEVEDGRGGLRQALKLSSSKLSYPGCKQVWRRHEAGRFAGDTLGLAQEQHAGEAQLVQVMADGHRLLPSPSLAAIQQHTLRQLSQLPPALQALETEAVYPVAIGAGLQQAFDTLKQQMIQKEIEK